MAQNLYRHLNMAKEKSKDLEIIMNEAENKQSKILTEIESQKYQNEENERTLADIEKQKSELEKEDDNIQAEKDRYQMMFR